MKNYQSYFDKQTISPSTHEKLLSLGKSPAQMSPFPLPSTEENEPPARFEKPLQRGPLAPAQRTHRYSRWLALAACAALILGVGTFALKNRPAPMPPVVGQTTPGPTGTDDPTGAPAPDRKSVV